MRNRAEIVVDYADMCWNSCWLHGHDVNVGIVVDYVDRMLLTTRTQQWLRGHFRKNFEGFSQILKEQSGKQRYICGCVYTPNSNNLKNMKISISKEKCSGPVVDDYEDGQFSNCAIEYLRKNKNLLEHGQKSHYTVPLSNFFLAEPKSDTARNSTLPWRGQ